MDQLLVGYIIDFLSSLQSGTPYCLLPRAEPCHHPALGDPVQGHTAGRWPHWDCVLAHLTPRAGSSLLSWAWHTSWCSLCHPSSSPLPFTSTGVPSPVSWIPRGVGCPFLQAPDLSPKRQELEGKLGWFPCERLSFCTTKCLNPSSFYTPLLSPPFLCF